MRKVQRMLILLLSVLLVVGLLPTTAQAEEASESRFILVAEGQTDLIIAPEYVSYTDEQKIGEVLESGDHEFTFSSGLITAINGVTGSYNISDQNGNGDLNALASSVTHFRFSTYRENSDRTINEGLRLLMTAMADYLEEDADVQKAAKDQYQEARKQFIGIDSNSAKTLAKSLTDAINNYRAILNGETYEIRFTDGEKAYSSTGTDYPGVSITAINQYGKTWLDEDGDGALKLPFGTYEFCVLYQGLSVSGTVEASSAKEIPVALKTEKWLTDFRLSSDYLKYYFEASEFQVDAWDENRMVSVPVYDNFSGTVYTYAKYDTELLKKVPTLTAVYTMKNAASSPMEKKLTFQSWTSGANSVLAKGAEGNTVIYRVSSVEEDGYTYAQDYTVNFVRIPTLESITVEDQDGTDQAADSLFDSKKAEYIYKVLNTVNKVKVKAVPLIADYEIQINGQKLENGIGEVEITGNTDIEVTVSGNGYSNTYSLKIQPGEGQIQTFTSMKDVTLQVFNKNGVEIPYTSNKGNDNINRYLFTLVPGEPYSYIATYDTYYHIADEFTPNFDSAQGVKIDFDKISDWNWLTELQFGTDLTSKNTLALNKAFDSTEHHYQVPYVDTEFVPYVWATSPDETVSMKAIYDQIFLTSLYHGVENQLDIYSGSDNGVSLDNFLMDENPIENTVTIQLAKEVSGVTYSQDYQIDFRRELTVKTLTAACDGMSTILHQSEEKTGFVSGIKDYFVKVSMAAKQLVLDVAAPAGDCCYGEDQIGYRITVKEKDQETLLQEAGRAVIELDGTIDTQTVTITVENDKAPEGTASYVIKILKAPPVETTFSYFPQSALLNLREASTGERLWPDENGKFLLCESYSYDYVLSEYGYVGKAGRLTVTQNDQDQLVILEGEREYAVTQNENGAVANITWNLTAAEPNENIDTSITSPWPNFRGGSTNNAVTSAKVPTAAENGTLYWANKIGSGIDSDAVGSPILVGDDIITYASDNLFRVNTVTGEIMATGKMDHKSSFSITPPTYAEGMVFVALSNGCVQAFNAATLESLWIYNDPLGGQPNCPLTVKDGYLYTGFWNSETGNANFVCLSITDENPNEAKEEKYASWFHTAKGGYYWAGAYAGSDFILIGTDDGDSSCTSQTSRMLLLDKKTGKLLDSWDNLNGDIRSTVVYDSATNAYYFTSKGGSFYSFQVSERKICNQWNVGLDNGIGGTPMSTCSPVVYNGRAYVGVSGAGQFTAYSGHNITVIDLGSQSIAYSVKTQGYPQTSGLLTTAYNADTGYAYVYFFDNYTPGKLRVLRDKPSMTGPDMYTQEGSRQTAYALFTPTGDHAQYAICSPIVDEYGTIYFKNDSANLMAFGSTITELQITTKPSKTTYLAGESFDPSGMAVTAVYANGKTRDVTAYVSYSTVPLTVENPRITISYAYGMYQNQEDGQAMKAGEPTPTAIVNLELTVQTGKLGDVDGNGTVEQADAEMILDYEAQLLDKTLNPMVADVSGDGVIDSNDSVLILQYPEIITKFPAEETVEESQPNE